MSKFSKFTYPKCPYCKEEYNQNDFLLVRLATEGWKTEEVARCKNCGKQFIVSIHINYYGRKIKNADSD